MISKIRYAGSLRTEAIHLNSKNRIITDAPLDNNGKGQAFSPTDLVATSLGACMLTIMGIVAERHQIKIEGTNVEVDKIMSQNPRRIGEVSIIINFVKKFNKNDRKILETAARTCPVSASLHPDIIENIKFIYP
ncbi:MAG: osmotically inducible protein OsmC [Candidatus Marinimicrobia bacterium]|nr:osmotically inducible protein OsmC [Candidatus Neomarinimicrobiota bacterium]|tara:strand:+ start:279 stop:680 length:402 start_codon:yes stop_codon:yes gene_type:complete